MQKSKKKITVDAMQLPIVKISIKIYRENDLNWGGVFCLLRSIKKTVTDVIPAIVGFF